MTRASLVKLMITASNVFLAVCLIAGLTSGGLSAAGEPTDPSTLSFGQASDDDPSELFGPCPAQAAPNATCYDYICPQPPDGSSTCTPQCNKACACVLGP